MKRFRIFSCFENIVAAHIGRQRVPEHQVATSDARRVPSRPDGASKLEIIPRLLIVLCRTCSDMTC